jgi:hypothetical protein
VGETDGNYRVTCIDKMEFDEKGFIKPVKMTFEGVSARPLPASPLKNKKEYSDI